MYDFKNTEEEVLKYWKKHKIYPKLKKRNSKGKKYYYLQGPPYTSGHLHMGHAWNNSMKDMIMRYYRMKGRDVWDRGGYDMHGLPTARQVMKELKIETKEEILEYGLEKFINNCMDYANDKANIMSKDLWRMGIWMDHENAYKPIENSYIESVWWLIKQAHDKKRLYKGLRTLTWCPKCASAMAKHECIYKNVTDTSIFLKFKVKNKKNEYLIIWTTTPWTIPFNVGIMVHPELEYLRVKVEGETWIVAKGLASAFIKGLLDKDYKVLEKMKGEDLEGLPYEHFWEKDVTPFKELKKKHPKIHTIVLSEEYVSLKAGSGLVHMAAGCGPEDYEIGHRNNIPPFNNLSEKGVFPKNMGRFSNWTAKKDDKNFIKEMKNDDVLIVKTDIEHDYAHCERCKSPVIFRATEQWFFKTEDLREKMLKENEKVHWVPEAGRNAFDGWLTNLRDNSITKQRFWGTPAPIWINEKDEKDYIVIGSIAELKKLAKGKLPKNLHKPWIDDVVIEKGGKTYKRLPDVLDVWIDAGCASWACLYYPQRTDYFKKYFPADFILEAKEQVRGWFNLLMVASILGFDRKSFNAVYMHGMLTDVQGVKMSKSIGNIISPYEIIDKYGTDTMRSYLTRVSAGEDANFSWDEVKLVYKNFSILWNVHKYLISYCRTYKIKPKLSKELDLEEKYILSKLHNTIKKVTAHMDVYELDNVPKLLDKLYLDLSRTYIQWTRDKINEKPEIVLGVIYEVVFNSLKIMSVLTPFITEKMYLNLKDEFKLKDESVHNLTWPGFDEKMINESLEEQVETVQDIIQATLSAREKASISVRWPISKLTVVSSDKIVKKTIKNLDKLLLSHVNIKDIKLVPKLEGAKVHVEPNKNAIGKDFKKDSVIILKALTEKKMQELVKKGSLDVKGFGLTIKHINMTEELPKGFVGSNFSKGVVYIETGMTKELEQEGFAREVTRRIQQMRKEEGLKKVDTIDLVLNSKYNLGEWLEEIRRKVGAKKIETTKKKLKVEDSFKIKGKSFYVSFKKV